DIATADMAFEAFGKSLNELFENAALAMFEVMTETSEIQQKTKKTIKVKSEDLKALLFDFLSELLFLKDSEYLVFSKFSVKIEKLPQDRGYSLEAEVAGDTWDRNKHEIRTEVKAMTYSEMEIEEVSKDKFRAQVVLDT
ncbi:MAG: archease, partial [Candidatus Aenigmatarchaeota archaeon]